MKRLDVLIAAVLTLLASFVGVEAYATRQAQSARHLVRASGANALPPSADGDSSSVIATSSPRRARRPLVRAPAENPAEVRRRLESGSPGTYIGEVLASHDSALARWPERRVQPLRVWIQPVAPVAGWSASSGTIVRDAFLDWGATGIPVNFSFVLDSAAADVRVSWTDRFKEPISGKTLWSHDDRWWILEANIVLAVHHRSGEVLDKAAMRAIALHEIGHLIGLDHTSDTTSIMTPRVRVKELSDADRATARLLYTLPPGRIGASARR